MCIEKKLKELKDTIKNNTDISNEILWANIFHDSA